tara:strand:- start:204 stop:449 length:246 start_codon:yes stop_codon:yes gene_type:complete
MVQAMINISKDANQILNIVKAKKNFKDKSEAIDFVTKKYGEDLLEPELRPEYIEKIKKIEEEGYGKTYGSIEELKRDIESK